VWLGTYAVSWGELNGDGYPDIYCLGMLSTWDTFINDFGESGEAVFEMREAAIGGLPYGLIGDVDNDGDQDIFGFYGPPVFFGYNDGVGNIRASAIPPGVEYFDSRGGALGDFNNDTYLDIYIGGYEVPTYMQDQIYSGNSDGSFTNTWSQNSGDIDPARGVTTADYDADGDLDIYVSNYRLEYNQLYKNLGDGTFEEVGDESGVGGTDDGWSWSYGHTIGSVFGDMDNDGYLDLFVGNFSHPEEWQDRPFFLRNTGPPSFNFEDMSDTAGLAWQESFASPALIDFDNDGDLDLYFTTVYEGDYPVLYRNEGGWVFSDVTAAMDLASLSFPLTYQNAWADFDRDGDLDVATGGKVYENIRPLSNWLEINLVGDGETIHRNAIGAQATINLSSEFGYRMKITRQVVTGVGEGNQNDMTLHFGLSAVDWETVDVEVLWPGGEVIVYSDIPVNQVVTITYDRACGDFVVDLEESCDEGGEDTAICNSDCTLSECGDSYYNPASGEECDLGGGDSVDCDSDCTLAVCGDGWLNPAAGELCDDGEGNADIPDACRSNCITPHCGDLIQDTAESCDSGGVNRGWCDSDCTEPLCGDSHVNLEAGEICDQGGIDTGECDSDCTEPLCGDFYVNLMISEQCDEGAVDTAGCDGDCSTVVCGDRYLNTTAGELCDHGFSGSMSCDTDCTLPVCGDGLFNLEAGEQCDDGEENADLADACRTNCMTPYCGDLIQDSSESCDSGGVNRAWCDSDCTEPVCGDGLHNVPSGEACDDGGIDTVSCNGDCSVPVCGDFYWNSAAGESCDEGAVDTAGCDGDCSTVVCGDGYSNALAGEECDGGEESSICDGDCTEVVCGDGWFNREAGEQCDDGEDNADLPDQCRTNCMLPICGDFIVDFSESCDSGGLAVSECDPDCSLPQCGDLVVNTAVGETCDTGILLSDTEPDACRTDCVWAHCGDGILDSGELCDHSIDTTTCDSDCTRVSCGDSFVNPAAGELCDLGSGNSDIIPDSCRTDCVWAYCGDGVLDSGETCDSGVLISDIEPDSCRSDCMPAHCGDSVVDEDEACDTGDLLSDTEPSACRTDCSLFFCGDEVVDADESCDTGELLSDTEPDACRLNCVEAFCGDGVEDTDEICDAGTLNSDEEPDVCRTDCSLPRCGDAVIDSGESCDTGELLSDLEPNACRTDCVWAYCGDGVLDSGESCDTADLRSDEEPDACRLDCELPFCGDGIVDSGEECEPVRENECQDDCTWPVYDEPDMGLSGDIQEDSSVRVTSEGSILTPWGESETGCDGCGVSTSSTENRGYWLVLCALGFSRVKRTRRCSLFC
jgi:hypothetical protein